MQHAKALKLTLASTLVGTIAAIFLTLATVPFATPTADATPALAKGKACKTCHSSATPSKSDLKKKMKKSSELWPNEGDSIVAHLSLR